MNFITDQTNTLHNNSNLTNESSDANNTVTMMMMPLGKLNKQKSDLSNQLKNTISTPPPKPDRLNNNFLLKDFSPIHASTINKKSYLLKKSLENEAKDMVGFDDDISAIILNRDDIEKCSNADILNSYSPTYKPTVW